MKSKLEDVVGVFHKPEPEFCEHIIHSQERQRKAEKKLKEKEKDIIRKVAHPQMGELTANIKVKKAKGIYAPVTKAKDSTPQNKKKPQNNQTPFQAELSGYLSDATRNTSYIYPVIIYTNHRISELLDQGRFVLASIRNMHSNHHLLTYPDITVKQRSHTNPAERIPLEYEGELHDCVAESLTRSKLRPDLESTPLLDKDVTCFMDGSCCRNNDGHHAGFVVVHQLSDFSFVTVMAESACKHVRWQKEKEWMFTQTLHMLIE